MNLRNVDGDIAPLKQLPYDKVMKVYSHVGINNI